MRRPIGQVIASLLIVQRVASKSALTSKTVASGRISEFEARSREELTGRDTLPSGHSTSSQWESAELTPMGSGRGRDYN